MGWLEFLFGKPKSYAETRRELPASTGSPRSALPAQPSVLKVRVGDVISYNLTDFVVRNRYVYQSHGFNWYAYYLNDSVSGEKFWVDAEDDDGLAVGINRPIAMTVPQPVPARMAWEGVQYQLDEHGYATVLVESEDSPPRYVEVEYWDFLDASEQKFLGIERWGGEFEVSLGHSIAPYDLTILHAGGERA